MTANRAALLTDWVMISARWLFLLAAGVSLVFSDHIAPTNLAVLLGAAAGNSLLTLLAAFKRRLRAQAVLALAGDLVAAALLYLWSGAQYGPLRWSGVLPLASAGLYFQIQGVLVVIFISLLAQGSLALSSGPALSALLFAGALTPPYIGVALASSLAGRKLRQAPAAPASPAPPEPGPPAISLTGPRPRALLELISALSATLSFEQIVESALDLGAQAIASSGQSAESLVGAVLLFSGLPGAPSELKISSARGFPFADLRLTLPGSSGVIGQSIESGHPSFSAAPQADGELNRLVAFRACQAAYCLPLRSGMETYGVMVFGNPQADFFSPETREMLEIIARQAVIALQNARLYQALEQEKERMLEIQEEARKKMARDLHDGPTQSVAAIAMRVNFARRLMERDPQAAAEELFKIEELARRTTKEIRHMLFTLRPLVLESQGLIAALESMAEKMAETYGQAVLIEADPKVADEVEMGKQGVIFAIVEEAANNARKHARAAHIWVRLKFVQSNLVLLEVQDDGIGFNPGEVDANYENRGSLGMVNMRERAELVNGLLNLQSAPGRGTLLRVVIPLDEKAADQLRRGK